MISTITAAIYRPGRRTGTAWMSSGRTGGCDESETLTRD
jgi:hypothetical protein